MPNLTSELRNDHSIITDTLKKVIELGVSSEQGRKLLLSAKARLLAHLNKEDTQLYPVLWKAAENDDDLKNILDTYVKEMDGISKNALAFFEKYSSGTVDEAFTKDFRNFYRVLSDRILSEESVIYKKYDELVV